jgi:hypothetical protein
MAEKDFTVYIASTDDFESSEAMIEKIMAGELDGISEYAVSFPESTSVVGYEGDHTLLAETIAWGEASYDWQRDNTFTVTCAIERDADGNVGPSQLFHVSHV